ncbi:MipA/OmpV family protein [Yersinia nurmii]|uniref:MipA/OmpV family protein n=1 Tax=Yersinia nurmii TaxID=685706 RepID=A0AAW7K7B3_9GAMM|nr:MipA/OmpV family protein [Yersinia nurmii]MDN0086610.1 MipA/OmpV family protein [Yersinia nurmii]
MKTFKLKTLAAVAIAISCASAAHAGTWSLGASALVSPDPYLGKQDRVYPVPVINYEGDDFYFRTLAAGYYLWRDDSNRLTLDAYYLPLNFKPGDSDDWRMKQLDKRRSTLMAGVSYAHTEDWGIIRTAISGDMLDNSNGLIGDVAYLYKFQLNNWLLTPGVGVTWNSKNQNKYYYGVSGNEAARSTLSAYEPSDSWSPYAELSAHYQINASWNAFFLGRYIQLSSEVKNSPMVDKSYTGIVWTGVTYTF